MTHRGRPGRADTAAKIIAVAEELVQIRGFNGFSYADVAAELHITTASLHYHFAGKAELGQALISGYALRFGTALSAIAARPISAYAKLQAYVALYADVLEAERMCLCGMLAAEFHTLPKPMRDAVNAFFDDNEAWLRQVLDEGRARGTLRFAGPASEAARTIVSGLEGAMLLARSYGDVSRFHATAHRLLAGLAGGNAAASASRADGHAASAGPRRRGGRVTGSR